MSPKRKVGKALVGDPPGSLESKWVDVYEVTPWWTYPLIPLFYLCYPFVRLFVWLIEKSWPRKKVGS